MSDFVHLGVQAALVVLVLLMIPCAYRATVGPTPADRLQAIDTMTTRSAGRLVPLPRCSSEGCRYRWA